MHPIVAGASRGHGLVAGTARSYADLRRCLMWGRAMRAIVAGASRGHGLVAGMARSYGVM